MANQPKEHISAKYTANAGRVSKLQHFARTNRKLASAIDHAIQTQKFPNMTEIQTELAQNFVRNLTGCCRHNIVREHHNAAVVHVGSHTCGHKLCMVCNMLRKRKVRRLFIGLFEKYPDLYGYTLLNCTLTVPHTASGWNGKEIYTSDLLEAFKSMRNAKWWKRMVFGGVYNVEMTKNTHGLHIHVHTLVMLHNKPGNRNEFYRLLLEHWNNQTVWPGANRQRFTMRDYRGLFKSLCSGPYGLPTPEGKAIIRGLDPRGSTMVSAQNLFTWRTNASGKLVRSYCAAGNREALQLGILETLKYHFKPADVYYTEDSRQIRWLRTEGESAPLGELPEGIEEFDLELIFALLPAIYRQRMYGRFGMLTKEPYAAHFRGEDDLNTEAQEVEREEVVYNPITMLPEAEGQYTYTLRRLGSGPGGVVVFDTDEGERRVLGQGAPMGQLLGGINDSLAQFFGPVLQDQIEQQGQMKRYRQDHGSATARKAWGYEKGGVARNDNHRPFWRMGCRVRLPRLRR